MTQHTDGTAAAAVQAAGAPRNFPPIHIAAGDTRVIVVGGLKGGVGKSTLALFIAMVYAVIYGKKVLFVDADPSSQTGWDWWEQASKRAQAGKGKALPFDIELWPHAQVGAMVQQRALGRYDVVVVDCGGDSDRILASAMQVAQFVLMVTSPSKTDMRRLYATFTAARSAATDHGRADQVDVSVVLTQVDKRRDRGTQSHNQRMRDQITGKGRMPLCSAEVSLKGSVYADSNGHLVDDPDDLAEVTALVGEIERAYA